MFRVRKKTRTCTQTHSKAAPQTVMRRGEPLCYDFALNASNYALAELPACRGRFNQLKTSTMQSRKITRNTTIHLVTNANVSDMVNPFHEDTKSTSLYVYPRPYDSVQSICSDHIPPYLPITFGINADLVPYTLD